MRKWSELGGGAVVAFPALSPAETGARVTLAVGMVSLRWPLSAGRSATVTLPGPVGSSAKETAPRSEACSQGGGGP